MKILKVGFFFLLPFVFLMGFTQELSAKCHRKHSKRSRTSFSFNVNMNANPYVGGYTVITPPAYYEQVTVVRPYAPVYPVVVQRPATGVYFYPSFSYWRY